MTPDSPETTPSPPVDAAARETARQALDGALTVRTVRGEPTTHVNLALFGDALRHAGVPIEFRRGASSPLPALSDAGEALGDAVGPGEGHEQPKSVGDATDASSPEEAAAAHHGLAWGGSVEIVVNGHTVQVPWEPDDEVAALIQRALNAADVPHSPPGVLNWWELRDASGTLLDPASRCGDFGVVRPLFLAPKVGGGATDRPVRLNNPYLDGVLSQSELQALGRRRPPWWGTTPPEGSRRELIGKVLAAEDVLSDTEVAEFRDGIERALVNAEDVGLLEASRVEAAAEDMRAELKKIGEALDSQGIPVAVNADRLTPVQRVEALVERYARQRATIESLATIPERFGTTRGVLESDRPETFPAKVSLGDDEIIRGWKGTEPAEGTRRALIRDTIQFEIAEHPVAFNAASYGQKALKLADAVESALLQSTIDEEADECVDSLEDVGEGLSDRTGQRIARALETLTASTGGALRELLDRTTATPYLKRPEDDLGEASREGMGS